jgi:hypothetical protein
LSIIILGAKKMPFSALSYKEGPVYEVVDKSSGEN